MHKTQSWRAFLHWGTCTGESGTIESTLLLWCADDVGIINKSTSDITHLLSFGNSVELLSGQSSVEIMPHFNSAEMISLLLL